MRNLKLYLSATIAVLVLIGCGPKPKPDDSNNVRGKGNSEQNAQTSGVSGKNGIKQGNSGLTYEELYESQFEEDALLPKEFKDPSNPLSTMKIYFDYDSSTIKEKYHQVILAHSEFLMANEDYALLIEGHTDEKGTREYNIGLGERRANAVRNMIELQGVSPDRIKVISYGEEKPDSVEQDEISQSQNRRAILVYTKR